MAEEARASSGYTEKKVESFGSGCLVQCVGLVAPFLLGYLFGVVGVVIGVVFLLLLVGIGGNLAVKWRCGVCKNPVAGKEVAICPTCKSNLRPPKGFFEP